MSIAAGPRFAAQSRFRADGKDAIEGAVHTGGRGPFAADVLPAGRPGLLRATSGARHLELGESECTGSCCGFLPVVVRRFGDIVQWSGWEVPRALPLLCRSSVVARIRNRRHPIRAARQHRDGRPEHVDWALLPRLLRHAGPAAGQPRQHCQPAAWLGRWTAAAVGVDEGVEVPTALLRPELRAPVSCSPDTCCYDVGIEVRAQRQRSPSAVRRWESGAAGR